VIGPAARMGLMKEKVQLDERERTIIGSGANGPAHLKLPETLRIFLSFTAGPLKGQKIRLDKTVVTVGRKAPADIIIPDPTVSSAHAIFEIENEVVTVKDSKSTNGTLVSGKKITESKINNMDEVGFGDSRALLTVVKDTYGLYSEDEGDFGAQAEQKVIEPPKGPVFDCCLIAGYGPAQMAALRDIVDSRNLAGITSTALNGSEFLELSGKFFQEKKPIDIIITEVRMQGLNGVQAAIAFRSFERGFGLKNVAPIVFFTEMPKDQNIEKAVEFLKPCKYLQSTPDRTEFERRARALVERLAELGARRK